MKLDEIMEHSPATLRQCLAEFSGTFMLVFTVGCNVLAGSAEWGALSIACVLALMVYVLGPVSGAHLNPAVSVALGIAGKEPWPKVAMYSAMQCMGGLCAAFGYYVVLGSTIPLGPTYGHALWQAALAEVLDTCMLALVVLNVACSKMHAGQNGYFGLAIGGVIVAGAYSGGSVSMGCFNPAVALSIDVPSGGVQTFALYTVCELLGAALAAGIFRFCRPDDYDTIPKDATGAPAYPLQVKLAAEFTGTFFLMFTAGLDIAGGAKAAAVSIAAALTVMIFALGSVSGGHFNPAVTLAIFLSGRSDSMALTDSFAYAGVQVLAGIVAAALVLALTSGAPFALAPIEPYTWAQALLCEVIFTFVLALVVLSTTTKVRVLPLKQFAPLAIGASVVCGALAAGRVSGGVLNPAVAAGVAVASSQTGGGAVSLASWLPFTLAELLGAAFAAGLYSAGRPAEKLGSTSSPSYSTV